MKVKMSIKKVFMEVVLAAVLIIVAGQAEAAKLGGTPSGPDLANNLSTVEAHDNQGTQGQMSTQVPQGPTELRGVSSQSQTVAPIPDDPNRAPLPDEWGREATGLR